MIRGSAINNDGRSSGSMGTTKPDRPGGTAALRLSRRRAVRRERVDYIEAHGTGTRAGDPVELGALGCGAWARGVSRGVVLSLARSRPIFGHTEAAAGVAGLIKAALALHHGAIPPSLHFRTPNPAIPWADLPLVIPRSRMPWPRATMVRASPE